MHIPVISLNYVFIPIYLYMKCTYIYKCENNNKPMTYGDDSSYSVCFVQILQTKKSFPFGTAVSAYQYNRNAAGGKYRDFIHTHFNWAVPENALKWPAIEPQRVS